MDYITYKRFRGNGIDGFFNLRFGTIVHAVDGFLFEQDGRCICAVTSENGWGHFRPNTPEGEHRQEMLDELYRHYESGAGDAADFDEENWPGAVNLYWKNLLRTMPTDRLEQYHRERCGGELQ